MDVPHCSALQLQDGALLFHCESLLDQSYQHMLLDPAMDPGYFSASSSLSPTSSVDSFSFSPTSLLAAGPEQTPVDRFASGSPAAPGLTREPQTPQPCTSSSGTRRSRSRYPGKKRQTASEREKLRMRDLTKALHHLRTFLPPSVAPATQTLTKIETLRLTIRYVAYLSAQLGLSQEVLEQRRSSGAPGRPQGPSHAPPPRLQAPHQVSSRSEPGFHAAVGQRSNQNLSVSRSAPVPPVGSTGSHSSSRPGRPPTTETPTSHIIHCNNEPSATRTDICYF